MADDDLQEDSIVIDLRSPETVARRCIILATIMQRFSIDTNPPDDPNEAAFDLREWLRSVGLWDDITKDERALFLCSPDSPKPESGLDVALNAEGLSAIAWALGLLSSLSDDHLAKLAILIQEIPAPWEPIAPWITRQSLRPEPEVAQMREFHEVWNWRLEVEPERRSAKGHELTEIERTVQTVTQDAIAADLLRPGANGGFTLDNIPVTAMLPSEIAELQLLTQERLIALNWICGFGVGWDNVPIDV